ncbi:MAG TPA: phage tail protein, partial [Fibrella sp.]
ASHLLYLLDAEKCLIQRFDIPTQSFLALPATGGQGADVRQFKDPVNLAINGNNLYVADQGNNRVQVFDIRTLALRFVWQLGRPIDVTAHAGIAYLLVKQTDKVQVYRHLLGSEAPQLIIEEPRAGSAERWKRLAVDREGLLYVLDPGTNPQAAQLRVYKLEDKQDQALSSLPYQVLPYTVQDAEQVRARFDPPPFRLDPDNYFCLPPELTRECDRHIPAPAPLHPSAHTPTHTPLCGGLMFDRAGQKVQGVQDEQGQARRRVRGYRAEGNWISQRLDSKIYRCVWHRIEIEFTALPPETEVAVSVLISEQRTTPTVDDERWIEQRVVVGQGQSVSTDGMAPAQTYEFLIHPPHPIGDDAYGSQPTPSRTGNPTTANEQPTTPLQEPLSQAPLAMEGRYLHLKIRWKGDGYATPVIEAIRVHYPRESYLDYLPAVFKADDQSRWFLERFLSIFQTTWDDLEKHIENIPAYFDPAAVPDDFLSYLAEWLAMPLEGEWNFAQKRRLLMAAPKLYSRRGTLESLRDYLIAYLENNIGTNICRNNGYPFIVESFRERQHFLLNQQEGPYLGQQGSVLWSPSVIGRLQLDVFSREGEARLVSTGDPQHDLFQHYAHRFRVFIPSAWVRNAREERMVRRALDAEKPAHTQYELCLIEPRLRVGIQSTVGFDTIIGAYPPMQLARGSYPNENAGDQIQDEVTQGEDLSEDIQAPLSLPVNSVLGYDTILGGELLEQPSQIPQAGLTLNPSVRVGVDTILN